MSRVTATILLLLAAGGFAATTQAGMDSVVHDPVKRGVVHNPSQRGVVFRPQTPGSSPNRPAVINRIPANPFYDRDVIVYHPYSWYYSPRYYDDYLYTQPDVPIRSVPVVTEVDADQLHPTYKVGRDWGQDLRREVVTWEQFVAVCRDHVLKVSEAQQDLFQRGFYEGYGMNAPAAWVKALQQARTPPQPAAPAPAPATSGPTTVVTPYGTVEAR